MEIMEQYIIVVSSNLLKKLSYIYSKIYIYTIYIYIYIYIPNSTKLLLCHSLSWFINQRINTMLPVDRLKT